MRGRAGVAGVPSSGHASTGILQEPKRALHLLPAGEVPAAKGDQRWSWTDGRAVVEPHSTDEGGEPQGFRGERPRYPLEGRGCPRGRLGRGNHRRDSELGPDVTATRPTIGLAFRRGASREVVSLQDEPAAGNLHGGVCEGGSAAVMPWWT